MDVEPWNNDVRGMSAAPTLKRKAWSACPNCLLDLRAKSFGGKPFYDKCPFCGIALTFSCWQRVLVRIGAITLAYGIPVLVGVRYPLALLFWGLLCYFPALVVSMSLFVRIVPTRYVREKESESVITLFRH